MAIEVLEINPIAASPLILLFCEILNKKNAAITTTGTAIFNGAKFMAIAIDSAPNPT